MLTGYEARLGCPRPFASNSSKMRLFDIWHLHCFDGGSNLMCQLRRNYGHVPRPDPT